MLHVVKSLPVTSALAAGALAAAGAATQCLRVQQQQYWLKATWQETLKWCAEAAAGAATQCPRAAAAAAGGQQQQQQAGFAEDAAQQLVAIW
jgi:hypothetical protein